MPNYSPARKVFSSVSKKIEDIPFDKCFDAYTDAKNELLVNIQADIDAEYEREIADMEYRYAETHEAPYEGNFSDSVPKPVARTDADILAKHTTERMKVDFINKYGIPLHIDWILEQAITLIGNMPVTRNSNGLISGTRFKYDNFKTPWLRGLFLFLMINTKSVYLKLQYKAPHKHFGALVPFIMYAHKLVKGTMYSEWDRDEIHEVVHSDLATAMTYEMPEFSRDRLLQLRTEGLTIKSGVGVGQLKNAITTHKLNTSVTDTDWNQVPSLVQVILTQIWMAHPDNRTKYMILDINEWDKMPGSLVPREVVSKPILTTQVVKKSNSPIDTPWD